jgi:sodium transport system ATP-binding protein
MLEVKNLTKKFHDRQRGEILAVDDISFSCKKGEIFGLLGPNGAGKTTTIRIISTLLKPDTGSVSVAGHDVATEPELVRRDLGVLPAGAGVYDRFTPREILRFFGKLCKLQEHDLEKRIAELAEMFDMNKFIDTRCGKLSTGMKQKVSIARAIIHDPPLLILDEPTNTLDVMTCLAVHDFIRSCKERGKCVLLSTHIMSEAEKLCDQIAIVNNGRLLALGTLQSLRQQTGTSALESIFKAVVRERVGDLV